MSTKRLYTTGDLVRHSIRLTVRCAGCGREAVIRGMELDRICKERDWDRDLPSIRRQLRFSQCGGRRIEMVPHGEQR